MIDKKKPLTSPADNIDLFGLKTSASSETECTGLIPTPPLNADEEDAYRDIFDFGPQNPDEYELPEDKK